MMSSINSLLTNDRANRVFCLALVILMCLRHAVAVYFGNSAVFGYGCVV